MCGIIGIYGNNNVVSDLYNGLIMLQHRGQDAAGITTYDGLHFNLKKGDGLVRDVFKNDEMLKLEGNQGLGNVRYPTAGIYESAEAQPFYVNSPFGISLVHNGNLTNYEDVTKQLLKDNIRHLNTASDSEVLLNVLADEILKLKVKKLTPDKIFKAMRGVYSRVRGGYTAIALIAGQGMLAFRDPHGIRPLIFGKRVKDGKEEFIFASESVALDNLGFKIIKDVHPSEVIFIDMQGKVHIQKCGPHRTWTPCIFEFIYLARPDSVIDQISVYKSRMRMGEKLSKQIIDSKLKIDSIIPVPDTSRSAALAMSTKTGIKYREGLVKNRYIGRTFIMPGQQVRQKAIRRKLNPINLEFRNRNVLIVDDSIVRGNTSKEIVEMIKDANPKKIYFASSAPPLKYPCLYGVDMPSKSEFIADKLNIPQICKAISADALFYQKLSDLVDCIRGRNEEIKECCTACFDGKYPTRDVTEARLQRAEHLRGEAKKVLDSEKNLNQLSLL